MSEYKPKITVIIPVFNGEKYIAQCLENILCQTYSNLEIIVVNDGSTDKTNEIAQKYPVKIINQKNSGVSVARNAGIECATGDYIHFMDVDDLINLEFYEKMLAVSLSTKADMVCSEVIHERLPGLSLRFKGNLLVSNTEDKYKLTNVRMQGSCCKYLFQTDFLRNTGVKFNKDFRNAQDLVFCFQVVFFANKIATALGAVYLYKNRKQSAMTSKNKTHRKQRQDCKNRAYLFCDEFAKKHDFIVPKFSTEKIQFKLFGIPFLKKAVSDTGKTRWYLFGIYVFQKKQVSY